MFRARVTFIQLYFNLYVPEQFLASDHPGKRVDPKRGWSCTLYIYSRIGSKETPSRVIVEYDRLGRYPTAATGVYR
jgi:hypothetical protein